MRKIFIGAAALLFAGSVFAQSTGTISLQVNRLNASPGHVPVLYWSTTPVARSCQASGGWSGTKSASGNQTLSAIYATTNYTLTCTWGSGTATVNWTPPTTNTNGTPLTNLARFRVLYGTSATSLTQSVTVDDPTRRSTAISNLAPGTWHFAVRAVNSSGVESDNSNTASKSVTGATVSRTARITIEQPTTGLRTASVNVWDFYVRSDGVRVRIGVTGKIALGRPCDATFKVAQSHYRVNRADVTLTRTPQSTDLVALCEAS
jgi:hypothetical protein